VGVGVGDAVGVGVGEGVGVGVGDGECVGVGAAAGVGEAVGDGRGVGAGMSPLPDGVQLTATATSKIATNRRTRACMSGPFRGTMRSHMSIGRYRFAGLAIAVVAFALFLILGYAVDHAPDPGWMMFAEMQWVNHSTLIAWWLTWFGWIDILLPLAIVLVVIAIRFPAWRSRTTFAIVSLLIAWQGTDLFQHLFARPRRLDWVVKHETAFSYPSSHTAIATGFYLLLAVFVARSPLRGRAWPAAALALLGLGIMWSRLALGAHYLTDVVGGVLLGSTIVATLAACWPTNVFEGRARATLE